MRITTNTIKMNLEDKKSQLRNDIRRYSRYLDQFKKKLDFIENCIQPKTIELYKGIDNFFKVKISEGQYEYILGGDGRSQPWSEYRTGRIAEIKLNKGIYLNDKQLEVVKEYVRECHNPDHLKIVALI